MSHIVLLELSDDEYAPIEREAAATGRTPAEVIRARLRPPAPPAAAPAPSSGIVDEAAVEAAMLAAARQMAPPLGKTPEELVAAWREKRGLKPGPPLSEEEKRIALDRLRRHFGSVDSGDPRSADNERIDADLAREYGRGLDGER